MAKKGFSPARLVIKVCIVLAIPVIVMSILPGPGGRPVIDIQSITPLQVGTDAMDASQNMLTSAWISLKQLVSNQVVTGRKKVMAYRWLDEKGNVQFSQHPPAAKFHAELIEISDRSVSMPKPDENLSRILSSYQQSKSGRSVPPASGSINSGSAKQSVQDATNVQSLMSPGAEVQADY